MTSKQIVMYGCDIDAFTESVKDSATYKFMGGGMVITGILSDAQELMAMGDNETARQYLNRAKALMFKAYDEGFILFPKGNI